MKSTDDLIFDMLQSIISIENYSIDSYEAFLGDEKTQDAIMYNLIIMGEAANKIDQIFKEAHPEIPWASIIGTRNVIVHGYDQVRLQIVWDILKKDLPSLKEKLLDLGSPVI
jgi:uncharacterized protein with HEPN domain